METHGVTVRTVRVLRGPNLHTYMPVLQIELDIGSYENHPSTEFHGFTERLTSWLPGLHMHAVLAGRAALWSAWSAARTWRTSASMLPWNCKA